MKSDPQVASSCHPLAHQLGRFAVTEFGLEGAFGAMLGTDKANLCRICNAAYLHGVIEHYLASSENLLEAVDKANAQVCEKLDNVDSGGWECRRKSSLFMFLSLSDASNYFYGLYDYLHSIPWFHSQTASAMASSRNIEKKRTKRLWWAPSKPAPKLLSCRIAKMDCGWTTFQAPG